MIDWLRRRLTYANVMATIAVFGVLVGGGAYAASKIGASDIAKNAIRSKHIKKNAVKTRKIAEGAVGSREMADGAVTANKIAPGLIPAIPDVPDMAYARVSGPGVVTNSKGVDGLSHTGGSALYCFDLSFAPQNGVASATVDASAGGSTAAVQIPASASCPDGSDANVLTRDGGNMISEQAFFVLFTS